MDLARPHREFVQSISFASQSSTTPVDAQIVGLSSGEALMF
jgi:hypothetical protein